jgi:gluconolactonase
MADVIPNDRTLRFDETTGTVGVSRAPAGFATCDAGTFDGIRLDDAGRVWAAAHDGLHPLPAVPDHP